MSETACTPCYRVVCCAFLSRALVCMFRNSNLIWVSPYINICYAAITIYISRHLFHLNLFNYDNCTGLLRAKTSHPLLKEVWCSVTIKPNHSWSRFIWTRKKKIWTNLNALHWKIKTSYLINKIGVQTDVVF